MEASIAALFPDHCSSPKITRAIPRAPVAAMTLRQCLRSLHKSAKDALPVAPCWHLPGIGVCAAASTTLLSPEIIVTAAR